MIATDVQLLLHFMPAFLLSKQMHFKGRLRKLLVSYDIVFFFWASLVHVHWRLYLAAADISQTSAIAWQLPYMAPPSMQIASIDVCFIVPQIIWVMLIFITEASPWLLGKGHALGHGTCCTKANAHHPLISSLSTNHPLGTKLADRAAQLDNACCKFNTVCLPR